MKIISLLLCLFTQIYLPAQTFKAIVVHVNDGDSFIVKVKATSEKKDIRLAYIDAPEYDQEHGSVSKSFTKQRILNKEVILKQVAYDSRNNRPVCELYYDEGNSLIEELIASGHAWHWRKYSDSKVLQQLHETARKNKIGLWKNPKPTPPWIYRWNKYK